MKYQLEGSNRNILLSNLPDVCQECIASCSLDGSTQKITCNLDKKQRRQGIKPHKKGRVYLCSSQQDDLKSTKTFSKKFQPHFLLLSQIDNIRENVKKDLISPTKRLTHNITSLNAHCLQEFYSVVSQDDLSMNHKGQLKLVEKMIDQNSRNMAKAFLRVLKNNRLMKTELSVFEKLYDANTPIRKRKHDVRKVFLSALHVYFQDFADKEIELNIQDGNYFAFFDYESIIVSLMHVADNATKYTCVKSNIDVSFEETDQYIVTKVRMLSIKITDEDIHQIFKEGFSGTHAKTLGMAGNGIGMSILFKLLELNDAKVEMKRNCDRTKNKTILSIPYEINELNIFFDKFRKK